MNPIDIEHDLGRHESDLSRLQSELYATRERVENLELAVKTIVESLETLPSWVPTTRVGVLPEATEAFNRLVENIRSLKESLPQ